MELSKGINKSMPTRDIEYDSDGVTVTYHFNSIFINEDPLYDGASIIKIDGFWPDHNVGKPSILTRWDTFVIPDGKSKLILLDSTIVEYPLELSPARPVLSDYDYKTYTKENVKPIIAYKGFYPAALIPVTRKNMYRDKTLLEVCVCPIKYDYQNRKVRIYKEFKYKVYYNPDYKETTNVPSDCLRNTFLNNIALNVSSNSPMKSRDLLSSASLLPNSHYLIITVPKYAEAANRLAEWKRTLGFDVHILSKSTWTTTQIKDTIKNAYSDIEYLLIIGGQSDVPAKSSNLTSIHRTDLYYGCLTTGYTPSIFRGRIPIRTSDEANIVINKIINYEKNPCTVPSMYNTGIHCAYFQDDSLSGYEDRRFTLTSERIRDYMLQIGKTVHRVYYAPFNVDPTNWNNGTYANGEPIPNELLRPNFTWDGDSTDIINYINQKSFYMLYRGHGGIYEWIHPQFTVNNINSLNNGHAQPVVFSICCKTGKFDEFNCFCETFLKKENGGCSAIFGATEDGWSGHDDVLAEGIFDAIWPSSALWPSIPNTNGINTNAPTPTFRLGQILDQGLRRVDEAYLGIGLERRTQCTYELFHCFGDPSMMIYTDTPTPFSNASIVRQNGSIYVNTGGTAATITYYNRRTGIVESYSGTTHTHSDDPEISVCISAHNKIPYIDAGTLYIQNATLTNNTYYEAKTIKVGNNVTTTQTQGDVNFSQGSYKLIGDQIELHPGTTISSGTTIEIKNN
jgi:hypothetical protein